MPSNSGKYNNERRIFYFQDATLPGPRGSLNRNIDIFLGGGGTRARSARLNGAPYSLVLKVNK